MRYPVEFAFRKVLGLTDIGDFLKVSVDLAAQRLKFSSSNYTNTLLNEVCPETGFSVLSLAAYYGNQTAVEYLLSREVLAFHGLGDLLYWSRKHKHLLNFLKNIFEKDLKAETKFGGVTLAHINAAMGDMKFFEDEKNQKLLIIPNKYGITPAFYAYTEGHSELIKKFVSEVPPSPAQLVNTAMGKYVSDKNQYPLTAYSLFLLGDFSGALEEIKKNCKHGWNALLVLLPLLQVHCRMQSLKKFPGNSEFRASSCSIMLKNPDYFSPKEWLEFAQVVQEDKTNNFAEIRALLCSYKGGLKEIKKLKSADDAQSQEDFRTWVKMFNIPEDEVEVLRYLSKIENKTDDELRLWASYLFADKTGVSKIDVLKKIKNKTDIDRREIYKNFKCAPNNIMECIENLEGIIEKNLSDYQRLAEFYETIREFQKAAECYKGIIECCDRDPRNVKNLPKVLGTCHLKMGRAFLHLKKYHQAEASYQVAMKYAPNDIIIEYDDYRDIANVYLKLGKDQEFLITAKEMENRWCKIFPTQPYTLYLLGLMALKGNNPKKAEKLFKEAHTNTDQLSREYLNREAFDYLFELGKYLPLTLEIWKKLIDVLKIEKSQDTNDLVEYFLDEFYKADESTKIKIQTIIDLLPSANRGVFEVIKQDTSSTKVVGGVLGGLNVVGWNTLRKDYAPKNLYANAILFNKEGKLENVEQIINCCSETLLGHYFKLGALGENKISMIVFTFLHTVIVPRIPIKPSEIKEDQKDNIARMLFYVSLYLLPNEGLAKQLIDRAQKACAKEFGVHFMKMALSGEYPKKIDLMLPLLWSIGPNMFLEAFSGRIQNDMTSIGKKLCEDTLNLMLKDEGHPYLKGSEGQKFFITMMSSWEEKDFLRDPCRKAVEIIIGNNKEDAENFLEAIGSRIKSSDHKSGGLKELCLEVEKLFSTTLQLMGPFCKSLRLVQDYLGLNKPDPVPQTTMPVPSPQEPVSESTMPIEEKLLLDETGNSENKLSVVKEVQSQEAKLVVPEVYVEFGYKSEEEQRERIKFLMAKVNFQQNQLDESQAEQEKMRAEILELKNTRLKEQEIAKRKNNNLIGFFEGSSLSRRKSPENESNKELVQRKRSTSLGNK